MKNYVVALLSSGVLMLLCSANTVYGQVPVEASPDQAAYETQKQQWISTHPAEYEKLQNRQNPQAKSARTAPAVSDGAAYEAEKIRKIKANTPANTGAKVSRKAPTKFTPNTGIVSQSQIDRAGGDYDAAKAKWVKENPKAYQRLSKSQGNR